MTQFDTIFNQAACDAGFSWTFVYSNSDRSMKIDRTITDYPCILRAFREETLPLRDPLERWEKQLNLYIIHTGFESDTSEQLNMNLEEIMRSFLVWLDTMERNGVDVTINGRPFPNWAQTDLDEYGYVFDLTCRYSVCQ
jgi:hypothetical protein